MIQHVCDRCKKVIDEKTGLVLKHQCEKRETRYYKEYRDGDKQWRHTVLVSPNGSDLCCDCICAVIQGEPFVEAASSLEAT